MNKNINFQNPLNGRKWLNLLEAHPRYSMLFKKNLDLDKSHLGFSFKTNKYGLRGKGNIDSNTVIAGTSYAMGLSVNNGKNWYELSKKLNTSFNIGMPIAPKNQINLLNDLYKGDYENLIYIYHPNLWKTALQHDSALKHKTDIFKYAKWEKNYLKSLKLYIKYQKNYFIKSCLNKDISYVYKNKEYSFIERYSYLDMKSNITFIDEQIQVLNQLFSKFKKITIIRVPIKEEIALKYIYSSELAKLKHNYNDLWKYFENNLPKNNYNIISFEDYFIMDDFLPMDTHWSKKGNQTFHKYLTKYL
jgi:hypothetical protein